MNPLDQVIADLTAAVERTTSVEDSATALVAGIPAMIQKAKDDALAAGATSTQLQSLTELKTALAAKADSLAAAVTANTPAA